MMSITDRERVSSIIYVRLDQNPATAAHPGAKMGLAYVSLWRAHIGNKVRRAPA